MRRTSPEDVIDLDFSIEDAFKFIVSGGIVGKILFRGTVRSQETLIAETRQVRILIRPSRLGAEVIIRSKPDSAVASDRKREVKSFRNEVDGFLLLRRHRTAVLTKGDV